MMRFATQELVQWMNKKTRMPLLIRGARQIGKTFLVESFAGEYFENFFNINFEHHPEYKAPFQQSLDPEIILRGLELIAQNENKVIRGKTLLFLDEIQECPEAIQALRYFKEKMPDLHVIGAGSLLEFVLNDADFRMPVGRVEFLYLKPCSFREFLIALGQQKFSDFLSEVKLTDPFPEVFHEQLVGLLNEYLVIGGMPAVIHAYANDSNFIECQQIQSSLLQTYRSDFGKYAQKTHYENLKNLFEKVPGIVAQNFKYADLDRELRAEAIKKALKSLQYAGLLSPVYFSSASGLPLSSDQLEKRFKLLFLDVGLVARAQYLPIEAFIRREVNTQSRGQLVEQFVGQELLSIQPFYEPANLYYWQRDKPGSQAEVDYLISFWGKIFPVEAKSGHSHWLKSLKILMAEKSLPIGIQISEHPLGFADSILSVPLYMVQELPRLLKGL